MSPHDGDGSPASPAGIERRGKGGWDEVLDSAEQLGVDWRTGAQAVAMRRVAEAARLRTIYP